LKNDLARLALFGIKEIDLDRGGGLCYSMDRERQKNKNEKGSEKLFHINHFSRYAF
jgi:hypothetical protein